MLDEGLELRNAFQYDEAIAKGIQAYTLVQEGYEIDDVFEAGMFLGYTYILARKPRSATEHLTEFERKYGPRLNTTQMESVKNRLAWSYTGSGLYEQAITTYNEAFRYAAENNDSSGMANAIMNIGIAQQFLARYDDSIENLKEALTYNSTYESDVALTNIALYSAYSFKSDYDAGFPYLISAYNYAKEHPNSINYKDILFRLSRYYYFQNELRKALSYAREGMTISINTNDGVNKAYFEDILGQLYSKLGEQERAITYFNSAITFYETQNNEREIQNLKINVAGAFLRGQEFASAQQILLDIVDEVSLADLKLYTYSMLSDTYRMQNDFETAKYYLDRAQQTADSADGIYADYIYYDKLNFPDEIISQEEKLETAFDLYEYFRNSSLVEIMEAEREIARAYEPIEPDSAFAYAYKSIEKLEKRRSSTTSTTLRNLANSRWRNFYYELADWEVTHNNDYEKAFELIEQSKSRALFDQIFEHQRMDLLNPEDPSSLKVLELEKRLDRKYQNLSERDGPDEELLLLELEYEAAIDTLIASNIQWRNLEYPSLSNLEDTQRLLDSKSAIISYGMTLDELYLFYISEDEVEFIPVHAENEFRQKLSTLVEQFRDGIINQEEIDELRSQSAELSRFLLDPVAEYLSDIEHLVIIPDGPLHLLPFEALSMGEDYLIERFSVKYIPSVSVYNVIEATNSTNYDRDVLGVAGSGFESGDGFYEASSQASFSTLPYALAEVDSVSSSFKDAMILKNEEVTEATFKNIELNNFRFIHLATHGEINEFEPSQSGLILSKKTGTELLFGEDGFLNAREISQLDIPAELVILSACNTGNGKVINGEGVMGLQRSFLVAGASSVMVSLWSIFDRSTPTFMNYFYDNLLEIEDDELSFIDKIRMYAGSYKPEFIDIKTLALQQTKIDMINHPYYDHPVHWAPFVLTGK